jgi:hypothetical protein
VTSEFRERLEQVESLVGAMEQCPDPTARETARELVRTLLELHAAGLATVLRIAADNQALIGQLADDELVSSLLLLHGLHPRSASERVLNALQRSRSRFRSLRGDVELIDATEELVRLRLRGEPSPELRKFAEDAAIEAVPDATIEFEEVEDPALAGRLPLALLMRTGSRL